jgi:hypothetical protein
MTQEPTQLSTLSNAAVEMPWRGDVIAAIKVVRAERNLGLKEAKDLADAYVRSSSVQKRLPTPFLCSVRGSFACSGQNVQIGLVTLT